MSMNAKYRAISARLARGLQETPGLVRAILDADAGDPGQPGLPPRLRALVGSLPLEVRERLAASPEARAQFDRVTEAHEKAATAAKAALAAAGFAVTDVQPALEIDKAWHGLHYLLAATSWQPVPPPGNAVLGGAEIGEDLGYGPARLMDPAEVTETADALGALEDDALEARFDPAAMTKAELYGGRWDDPAEREWLLEAFEEVRNYFESAAERGDGMLLFIV